MEENGMPYGNHLEFVIFQWTDDRSCMENCVVSYIYRKFSSFFYQTAMSNITTCCHTSVQVNDVSDFNVF